MPRLTKGKIEYAPGGHVDVHVANDQSAMMKWTILAPFITIKMTCHSQSSDADAIDQVEFSNQTIHYKEGAM